MSEIKISTTIDLIKNKKKEGIEFLYQYHYKLLYSTAYSVVKNEKDAEDVVSNVVIKLINLDSSKFPEHGEMSWIYKVVKNEAINYIKKQKNHDNIENHEDMQTMDKNINELFDMESYYELIQSLNDKQKEVITLKVLGELSHKEIADILNKPIGTIQWIYNTSIKKLRLTLVNISAVLAFFVIQTSIRVKEIYNDITSQIPNSDEMIGGAFSSPNMEIRNNYETLMLELIYDSKFLAYIGIITLVIIFTILFLKFSYKIPTKPINKNV